MKQYKTALVVGRFQPFHKGHLYLLKEALKHADKLIIAIGSSNMKNEENPFSFEIRKNILNKVLAEEKIDKKVIKIVPSPDHEDDNIWLDLLLKNVENKFDVQIGNNDWVNGIFEEASYKVIRIPYYKRHLYQGVYIRKMFQDGKAWETRVPKYLAKTIKENFLLASKT